MSNCLVACVVQAWTKSDGALASATSRARSKAALVFACAISISLTFRSRTFSSADATPLLNPLDGFRACRQHLVKVFAGFIHCVLRAYCHCVLRAYCCFCGSSHGFEARRC